MKFLMIGIAWYICRLFSGPKIRMGSVKEHILSVKTKACVVGICPVWNLERKRVTGESSMTFFFLSPSPESYVLLGCIGKSDELSNRQGWGWRDDQVDSTWSCGMGRANEPWASAGGIAVLDGRTWGVGEEMETIRLPPWLPSRAYKWITGPSHSVCGPTVSVLLTLTVP